MSNLSLRAVKAKHGDALILQSDDATVLIDGGPASVYRDFLKDHLAALDDGSGEPPEIDLMMVSHVDADHIVGILDLTIDMIDANEEDMRPPLTITRAWLNSFSDTLVKAGLETKSGSKSTPASLASAVDKDLDLDDKDMDGHTKFVLSSVGQGRDLRRNLKTLAIPINTRFDGGLVMAGADNGPWKKGDLSITIVGPTQKELDRLKDRWKKDLKKILDKEADKKAAAASMDTSVFNLSSIVCIAEVPGASILLTGDARGDQVLKWLEERGGPFEFDVFKMPHHGSDRNITKEVFEKIHAKHYLVSGNGFHGNPQPDMFELLYSARGNADYKIHLTYSLDEIKANKQFKKKGLDKDIDDMFAVDDWRKSKIVEPADGETSILLEL